MGFSKPSTERDCLMQIDAALSAYAGNPNSTNAQNMLAERIQVYMAFVRENGQDHRNGDLGTNSSRFTKFFGITNLDSPSLRYNKITTVRI